MHVGIVGAGEAGLLLGLALRAYGCEVSLVTDRGPEEMASQVRSTQTMFGPALGAEARFGLDLWDEVVPQIPGLEFTLAGPDGPALRWAGSSTSW
jgi:2-polyprenyl-6-methoxyphenol hydroxylase-like FAD-dependent oxidoreductase